MGYSPRRFFRLFRRPSWSRGCSEQKSKFTDNTLLDWTIKIGTIVKGVSPFPRLLQPPIETLRQGQLRTKKPQLSSFNEDKFYSFIKGSPSASWYELEMQIYTSKDGSVEIFLSKYVSTKWFAYFIGRIEKLSDVVVALSLMSRRRWMTSNRSSWPLTWAQCRGRPQSPASLRRHTKGRSENPEDEQWPPGTRQCAGLRMIPTVPSEADITAHVLLELVALRMLSSWWKKNTKRFLVFIIVTDMFITCSAVIIFSENKYYLVCDVMKSIHHSIICN